MAAEKPAARQRQHPRKRQRQAWALLALGLVATASRPQASVQDDSAGFERGLLEAVNRYRESRALAPLQPDPALRALAEAHSHDMARHQQLSHEGFDSRFRQSGRQLCVENLAERHHQPDELLIAWQDSPSHRANLLEPRVSRVGIAWVDGYVSLLACTPARNPAARR